MSDNTRRNLLLGIAGLGGALVVGTEPAVAAEATDADLEAKTVAIGDPRYVAPRGKTTTTAAAPLPWINVKDYGAKGDGETDDTAALRAAAKAGNHLWLPLGNYVVSSVADNTPLLSFVEKNGVVINGPEATLTNPTSYTVDAITPMFKFDACKNVSVKLKEYVGYELPLPDSHLGYRGATLVYALNGCDGVTVRAKASNLRYGVVAGAYAFPAAGYNKNFDIKLRTSFCGYPLAMYLSEGVRYDIDANDIHRAVYLAGCIDVKGVARWRDIHIAPYATLITDALTSGTDAAANAAPSANPTKSRGCRDIDISSIDKGSTVFRPSTFCAGISLSRVDPVVFSNIKVNVHVVGTDSVSTTVNGFALNSNAKSIWPRYAYNWEPSVLIDGLKISGVVDKSATTVTNGPDGALSIRAYESSVSHAATIRGLNVDNFIVKAGSAGYAASRLMARGLATPAYFRGFDSPGAWLVLDTSATVPTILDSSAVLTLDVSTLTGGSRAVIGAGTVVTALNGTTTFIDAAGGTIGGAGMRIKQKESYVTLTGASTSWAGAIPAGCLVLGVSARIKTAITGTSGFQVGVTGALTRYADAKTLTAGFPVTPADGAEASPRYYAAATNLIVTAKTSKFASGQIRLMVTYIEFPKMTN